MTVRLYHNDCHVAMRAMIAAGVQVHSVVSDPPYGLVSVVKRFGRSQAPAKYGSDGRFQRQSAGFMGSQWDGSGIENDPETWRLCYDLLLPGGYLVAFSSPRTGHRMCCAIEDAGFIIHPFIGWAYGSGFPKAHAAANAVAAQLGGNLYADALGMFLWEEWAYGTQARKPALEPIYIAQKPFSERNGALNLLRHGVGALNIDGCRVPTDEYLGGGAYAKAGSDRTDDWGARNSFRRNQGLEFEQPEGRWPANLILDGSPEVVAQFPETKGQLADASATAPSSRSKFTYGRMTREGEASSERRYTQAGATNFSMLPGQRRGDAGSAARFFENYPFDRDALETQSPLISPFEDQTVFYHAKAKSADRVVRCSACGERFIGQPTCSCRDETGKKARVTSHPTVKPIGLMRALVRHVTPVGGIVLDPFAGSGTTGSAALAEGMDAILIEREDEFAADIMRRFGITPELPDAAMALLGALGRVRWHGDLI